MAVAQKQNAYKLKWYHKNKDYYKKYREENRDLFKKISRRHNFKVHFGITIEDYDKMVESQGGRCAICKRHQSELKKALCIDHCHSTGKIRGLLCDRCNVGLGRFNDDISLMESAISYLRTE